MDINTYTASLCCSEYTTMKNKLDTRNTSLHKTYLSSDTSIASLPLPVLWRVPQRLRVDLHIRLHVAFTLHLYDV